MFGVIPAGQPPNTNPEAISQTQFAFNLTPPFNHIVIFILPGTQLPDGSAAGVYCKLPGSSEFRFLGALGSQKQSAIFKINAGSALSAGSGGGGIAATGGDDVMLDDATLQPATEPATAVGGNVVLGISVEPLANIESQLATLRQSSQIASGGGGSTAGSGVQSMVRRNAVADASTALVAANSSALPQVPTKVLAQRIIQNAFNFLSSFGDTVPLKSFQDWWLKFEKRLELDPGFLEREAGG